MFLDPTKFQIVAGEAVVNTMRAGRESVTKNSMGYLDSEELCEIQRQESRRGYIGVEIIKSSMGTSVRYDSGLNDFGLVASSRSLGGTYEAAEAFVKQWVEVDPTRRYGWVRK